MFDPGLLKKSIILLTLGQAIGKLILHTYYLELSIAHKQKISQQREEKYIS